jgi:hypothetical protein
MSNDSKKYLKNSASSDNGYNPLRWDCEKDGCFNIKRRPKIEMFAPAFPGKINFGDVDGQVEINGHGLQLEWKTGKGHIPTGQRIAYEKLTITGLLTALIVVGDAETMQVDKYCFFFKGKQKEWRIGSLNSVIEDIKGWVKWAQE